MTAKTLILDFDSTILQVEALDLLAERSLADKPDGADIAKEIARITDLGMEGTLAIDESLERRLQLLDATRGDIDSLVPVLLSQISPSFVSNKAFFETYRDDVFVISNGFDEYILPVVETLNIKRENVCANRFLFNREGRITGFDREGLLAQAGGKSKQLRALDRAGDCYVIGDGMTDFQMTDTGLVTKFIVYTGNVRRDRVVAKADHVVEDFDQFLALGYF